MITLYNLENSHVFGNSHVAAIDNNGRILCSFHLEDGKLTACIPHRRDTYNYSIFKSLYPVYATYSDAEFISMYPEIIFD